MNGTNQQISLVFFWKNIRFLTVWFKGVPDGSWKILMILIGEVERISTDLQKIVDPEIMGLSV